MLAYLKGNSTYVAHKLTFCVAELSYLPLQLHCVCLQLSLLI
jgi:hypothetical protein